VPSLPRLPLPTWLSSGRLRDAVELLLATILAVQLARLVWLALAPIGPVGVAGPMGAQPTRLRGDLLFAESPQALVSLEGYRLHGVRLDARGGAAIIAGPDTPQTAYRVGDAIASGVVLDGVAGDHVLVRTGSQRRRLDMASDAADSPMPAPASAPGPAPAAAMTAPAAAAAADADADAVTLDPARLLSEAGLRPNAEDGSTDGYTLMPRGDGALLRQAGLQPGDVLTSINGRALDAEHLQELQEELRHGGQARITYQRDGQSRVLTLKAP
jgi:general secretion pathway protein C